MRSLEPENEDDVDRSFLCKPTMTLELECHANTNLPIEVQGITPDQLKGCSESQIASCKIWFGRKQIEIGKLFRVRGRIDETETIVWQGNLQSVHWIGAGLTAGTMLIESDAGRHIGSQMRGGNISAQANVSDFVGVEMSGGTVRIHGNAGDLVGGNYPGSRFGMNRGTILIDGDAGRGTGQSMRRGTIAIGGNVGKLCGWNMLAGTIFVFGQCASEPGTGMTRGTIVLAGKSASPPVTFSPGGSYDSCTLGLMSNWLQRFDFEPASRLLEKRFQLWHGDKLNGGRGELLVADGDRGN